MGGWWLVGAKIKDRQGSMKDRVGENYEYEVRFRLKKANEKNDKMCAKCLKWSTFVRQKWGICAPKWGILLYKCAPNWGT